MRFIRIVALAAFLIHPAHAQVISVFGRTGAVTAAANDYSFSQLSGSVICGQLPALTGDISSSAGSCATALANVITAAGPIGDSTHIPVITYDAKGRLIAVTTAIAPWAVSGSDINYTSGRVAIGTATSRYPLDIINNTGASQLHLSNGNVDSGLYFESVLPNHGIMAAGASFDGTQWVAKSTSAGLFSIYGSSFGLFGNTGLTAGTAFSPTLKLHFPPGTNFRSGFLTTDVAGNVGKQAQCANPELYGADPTGAADASTIIQGIMNAINAAGHGCVKFGPGIFRLNAQIAGTVGVTLRGSGIGTTRSVVNNAAGGLALSFDNTSIDQRNGFDVGDFDMVCATGGNCGRMLSLSGTGPPIQLGRNQAIASNIRLSSTADATTEHFTSGLYLHNLSNVLVDGVSCYQGGNTTGACIDIDYSANTGASPGFGMVLTRLNTLGMQFAVKSVGGIEGIYINNSELEGAEYGIFVDGALGFGGQSDVLNVSSNDINARRHAIKVNNFVSIIIHGNDLYKGVGGGLDIDGNCLHITSTGTGASQSVMVTGNKITSLVASESGARLIAISSTSIGAITGNTLNSFAGGVTGIGLDFNTNKFNIANNTLNTASGATGSTFFVDSTDHINVTGNVSFGWSTSFVATGSNPFLTNTVNNLYY